MHTLQSLQPCRHNLQLHPPSQTLLFAQGELVAGFVNRTPTPGLVLIGGHREHQELGVGSQEVG